MLRRRRNRIGLVLATGGVVLGLAAGLVKPEDRGAPPAPRFASLNQELRRAQPGRDVAVLDLDALDQNVARIRADLGDDFRLRLVTKSLPSVQLVRYLMEQAGTDRLMVFTEGFIAELLAELERPADLLLGKPLPAAAARRLLTAREGAADVQWLVDTPERLAAYLTLAEELDLILRINFEIDVGLRRGGAREPEDLVAMLAVIAAHRDRLTFSGLMGYDGHVPHAPVLFGSNQAAVEEEFAAVQRRYGRFFSAGQTAFPDLCAAPLALNSGGSRTYFRYDEALSGQTPVNEVAMGSGFIAPAGFADLQARGHAPALLLASPVSKIRAVADIPLAPGVMACLAWWDPNHRRDFVMVGGSFPAEPISPPGLVPNPFTSGAANGVRNMVSSQSSLNGSPSIVLEVGDFVFFEPWEADALLWCGRVELVRDGKIVGQWRTYRGGA